MRGGRGRESVRKKDNGEKAKKKRRNVGNYEKKRRERVTKDGEMGTGQAERRRRRSEKD